MDLQLKDRCALVTGSHRGTGEVIARHLAAEGARVLVHGFSQATAEAVADTIPGAIAISGDLLTEEGCTSLWSATASQGPVDILVNNYGRAGRGSFAQSDSADWLQMLQENLLSATRLVRLAVPAMQQQGWGRVINLGTIGSTRPAARNPHYYAAKGALATMTQSLAQDVAATGITVNLVSPGMIRTPEVEADLLRRARDKGWGDTFAEVEARAVAEWFPNPMGRLATREEVADLVCFLASTNAGFIHGQNIRVDGGALGVVQ